MPEIEPNISPLLAYVGAFSSINLSDEWSFLWREDKSISYILYDIFAMVWSNIEGLSYHLGYIWGESVPWLRGAVPLTQFLFLPILGSVLVSMLLFEIWRRNFNRELVALLYFYKCNNNYCVPENKKLNVGGKNMNRYQTFNMNNLNNNKPKGGHTMDTNRGKQSDFGNAERQEQKKENEQSVFMGIMYIIIGLGIIFEGYLLASFVSKPEFSDREAPKFELSVQQKPAVIPPKPQLLDPKKIYNEEVKPVIDDCKKNNEEVLRKCLVTLDERMLFRYRPIFG